MGKVQTSTEGLVHAPADVVYGYLADMREHHPKFLPPAFSGFEVESGGVGAGTVIRFNLAAGGRTRQFRSEIAEPEPGRVLTESDTNSSAVTTFTVSAGRRQRQRADRLRMERRQRYRRFLRAHVCAAGDARHPRG